MAKYDVGDQGETFDDPPDYFSIVKVFPQDDWFNTYMAAGTPLEGQPSYRVVFEDGTEGILYESEMKV